jgi:hypothetical protein
MCAGPGPAGSPAASCWVRGQGKPAVGDCWGSGGLHHRWPCSTQATLTRGAAGWTTQLVSWSNESFQFDFYDVKRNIVHVPGKSSQCLPLNLRR